MTRALFNPFRPTRWEHQRDGFQLIWFTATADILAEEKSIYIRGSRGSGKTTLLRSICWEDLARNASLRLQRTITSFDHIGLYIRFPDHLSSAVALDNLANIFPNSTQPELQFHRFFSLLVELTCLERALTSLHELRLMTMVEYGPDQELHLVRQTIEEFPRLANFSDDVPTTFIQMARTMRTIVRRMNEAAGRGALKELLDALPEREPGELLSFATRRLNQFVRIWSSQGTRSLSFKFCLDDCEVLTDLQQKSINTLVRISQYPVYWVVSSVGALFDSTETLLEQQPLTDADRRIIHLDRRTEKDFRELCQAVVSLRLLFSVSEKARLEAGSPELNDFFPLADRMDTSGSSRSGRLGNRSVNDIMEAIASKSVSPSARTVVEAAERLRDSLSDARRAAPRRKSSRPQATLPMYEAYTLLLWQGREDAFRTQFSVADVELPSRHVAEFRNPAFLAWLRRKQRAAMLHFASTLGFRRLPLAGAQIVISLADRSIRDFLEIMGEIFEAYAKARKISASDGESLDKFATARSMIAFDTQSDGIYAASASYLAGVSSRAERNSDVVHRLIEGLGYYTSALQSSPDDPTVLGRAERGVFVVKFASAGPNFPGDQTWERERLVWRTIRQAEIAGYIRAEGVLRDETAPQSDPTDQRGRTVTFRLHRRFAPHFRFSYRGAYETVSLTPAALWPLCDPSAPAEPSAWAEAQFKRTATQDDSQLPLLQLLNGRSDD